MTHYDGFTEADLRGENERLRASLAAATKALDERGKSFCTWCKTVFPKGAEGVRQFRKHIAECNKHPLQEVASLRASLAAAEQLEHELRDHADELSDMLEMERREVDRLRMDRQAMMDTKSQEGRIVMELGQEVERLRAALLRFGDHRGPCKHASGFGGKWLECDCGWYQARIAATKGVGMTPEEAQTRGKNLVDARNIRLSQTVPLEDHRCVLAYCEKLRQEVERLRMLLADAERRVTELLRLNPTPVVWDDGAVALHIHEDQSAVMLWYHQPEEGNKDMEALRAWAQKLERPPKR